MNQRTYTKRDSETWLKRVFGACMLRQQGFSQEGIAERLEVPQSTVSRLLQHARTERWLVERPDEFMTSRVGKEFEPLLAAAEIQYRDDTDFLKHIQAWVPAGKSKVRERLQVKLCQDGPAFPRSAAEALMPLLDQASLVGVMYGRTLYTVIQELALDRRLPGKRCIPVAGDPVHIVTQSQEEYSASWLAADLEQRLTGGRAEEPSLTGVPAYIARRYLGTGEKSRGRAATPPILQFFNSIPGNASIFGRRAGHDPLIGRVDLLLTGIGIIHDDVETGTFIRERLEQETDTGEEALRRLIYGDIAGLLLPRTKRSEQKVAKLNRGWTGVQFADLERISRNAARDATPGNVVIAEAPQKAEMIKAVISRLACINTLVISHSLCAALKKL